MRFDRFLSDEAALQEMGERLRRLRFEREWTQSDLAEAAGISRGTVERLESGASTQLTNWVRCLRALGQLENLERLLPEAEPGPIELLEGRGRPRRRVRPGKAPASLETGPWRWGES
jgi:transcriptional regulator with XRE-family HTH domain